MATFEESIEVRVPLTTAYNQWTQFEEFPTFMEGVESVTQLDDTHLTWVAEVGGQRREWEAEITEQKPDERIAWTSRSGTGNAGVVTFHRIDDATTKVMLQLELYPQDWMERAAELTGIVKARVKGDLKRFKEFVEARGTETGAWRGTVDRKAG
jgi:uncharacterized membrane protein